MEPSTLLIQGRGGSTKPRVAFVGTLPPTQCGIATFTQSLARSVEQGGAEVGIVRLIEPGDAPSRATEVVAEWAVGSARSRDAAVEAVDSFDAVVVQHEFGIFGGDDGDEAIDFLERVTPPSAVVLHTVLPRPTAHQREVLERVIAAADTIVVQSESARRRIASYSIERPERIVVIPHGAWTTPDGPRWLDHHRPIVLTWGLVGPGKGLEHGIAAMAQLRDLQPPPLYVIAGETHPKVRAREGEAYREGLVRLATTSGVGDSVVFESRYRDGASLAALVRSADVVLLPYDSRDQVTSGVLVEAIAAGCPVVASAFPHAVEVLASGAGVVVPHGDSAAFAEAIRRILTRPDVAATMRSVARRQGRSLAWSAVGRRYLDVLERLVAEQVAA